MAAAEGDGMKKGVYSRRDWEPGDNYRMVQLRKQGMSFEDIARTMGKGKETVRNRYRAIAGDSFCANRWRTHDDAMLVPNADGIYDYAGLAKMLGRTVAGVKDRIYRLGLRDVKRKSRDTEDNDAITNVAVSAADRAAYAAARRGSAKLLAAYQRYFQKYHPDCDVARMAA